MSAEEEKIEQEIASNLKLPDINLLNKQPKFKVDIRYQKTITKKYIKSFLYKLNTFQYFNDLIELFNELKYSHLMVLCNYRFSSEFNPDLKESYNWKLKYHFENSVYRYYSFWELIGRFLNSYFDLRLEFDKNDYHKEGNFFFGRDVYPKIHTKYYHNYLAELFEIYESSKEIFDYRIEKTHKSNPSLEGVDLFDSVRTIMEDRTLTELRIRNNYSAEKLKKLSEEIYENIVHTLEMLGIFYEVGHDEVEFLDKEDPYKSVITIPTKEEIIKINQIINKS
ncbi:MAG: hypothetical protein IH852_01210 [Bacteroidetes bacterium]|nr:hypothetical protein [Bacteroidota bacterium]